MDTKILVAAGFRGEFGSKVMEQAIKSFSVSAKDYVKSAVNTIGWTDHCNGHIVHYMVTLSSKVRRQSSLDDSILSDVQ